MSPRGVFHQIDPNLISKGKIQIKRRPLSPSFICLSFQQYIKPIGLAPLLLNLAVFSTPYKTLLAIPSIMGVISVVCEHATKFWRHRWANVARNATKLPVPNYANDFNFIMSYLCRVTRLAGDVTWAGLYLC